MGQSKPLAGRKILIVEDNFLVAEDLCEIVRRAGGLINHVSATEEDALAALSNEKFDGALLDAQLQDGTCIKVAQQLRHSHTAFVVVTGYSHEWLAPELKGAPYLAKPFNGDELVTMAARHFTRD